MTSLESIQEFVCTVLATSRGVPLEAICHMVAAGEEIDSLEGVELIVAVEKQFGVHVGDDEISSPVCRSIPRIARLVAAKLGASVVRT